MKTHNLVQQALEQSQEDSRSLEKRLLALKAAVVERLMYSSRAELAQLPVGSFASAGRLGRAGTAPACPAPAAWAGVIGAGHWEPGLAAGTHGEPGRASPELGQEYVRCLITLQCFPTIHECTYLQSWVMCRLSSSWVLKLIRHISHGLKILKANFA